MTQYTPDGRTAQCPHQRHGPTSTPDPVKDCALSPTGIPESHGTLGWSMKSPTDLAATMLCASRLLRSPTDRLPVDIAPRDEADAYAIQDALHSQLAEAGWGAVVGYKIGCTTRVMQRYLGIANPCAGAIYASTVHHEIGQLAHADFVRVGVECEIAVLLADDLHAERESIDRAAAARAIGACMAAIEIVDDRYVDFGSLGAPTLIADDFFGAGCVLGPAVADFDPALLAEARASMRIDDRLVGTGMGTDILGQPLDALVWLANNLAQRGQHLRSGDFVLLGSLVQTQWVARGQSVVIDNDRLGSARADFR
jgi:2-keto-4-pentenoate hydratase